MSPTARPLLVPDPGGTAAAPPPAGVEAAVAAMMAKGRVPGLSVAVVDRDGVLLAAGAGLADRRSGRPATARTVYPWFSMTKVVTATAVLRLADEQRIDLAAPAARYVPYLRRHGTDTPTVAQLLTHTAGLANPLPLRWTHPAGAQPPDPDAFLRALLGRRRAYRSPAGGVARYSNVSYLALGQVVAAVTGETFQAHVRRSVLEPLGMTATAFEPSDAAERATGYVRAPRIADPLLRRALPRGIAGERHGEYLALRPFAVDGAAYGGLVGHALDVGRFLRMHLRDGELDGRRVLSADTARRMRVVDRPGKPFDHAMGWFVRPPRGTEPWVEHFGAGMGFWNVMRLYPERGLGVVVMANTTTTYDFEPLFALLAGARWS